MRPLSAIITTVIVLEAFASAGAEVTFEKVVIDKTFRSEGVAVGDVNHDGKKDVLAGDVWYSAPDWKMHELRPVGSYNPKNSYSNAFQNFAQDVNGDGWVDSIVVIFPGRPAKWYENPQNKSGHWKGHTFAKSVCNETPVFADLTGDGSKTVIGGVRPKGIMAWFSIPDDPTQLWTMHEIAPGPDAPGTRKFSHGLGTGDVNGDGRNDVIIRSGWWEAPEDQTQSNWPFHPAKLGPACAHILVYDLDEDGDNDIITSSAHKYGIWWFEQLPGGEHPKFRQHLIFKKYSQTHAMRLVDMNGDGTKDIITGKRHYAHHGKDPGGKDPAMLYWFEVHRGDTPEFDLHIIDDDSGVGTQFEVADMNDDKRPDIILSNKKGVHVFLQK